MNLFLRKVPLVVIFCGIVVILGINLRLMQNVSAYFDVTEDQRFSLSDDTKYIINKLDNKVTLRLYTSKSSNVIPIELRQHAGVIKDLISTIVEQSNGKVELIEFDVLPDSDAEDQAILDGVSGQPISPEVSAYLGVSATCLEKRDALAYLDPNKHAMLEYDLLKLIDQVSGKGGQKIAFISSLPILGNDNYPESMIIIHELVKRYELIELEENQDKIPDNVELVLLLHPTDLKEPLEKAIDRYVQHGGNLIVALDPVSVSLQSYGMDLSSEAAMSSWPKLINMLGVNYEPLRHVMDMLMKSEIVREDGPEVMNSLLSIQTNHINQDHPITAGMDFMRVPYAGGIYGSAHEGIEQEVLLRTSADSALSMVDDHLDLSASTVSEQLADFKADEITYSLASLFRGKFSAMFPDNNNSSKNESSIILFTDSDFFTDPLGGKYQKKQGRGYTEFHNSNILIFLNSVDYLMGNFTYSNLRSRSLMIRPLIKLIELKREVEKKYENPIKEVGGKIDSLVKEYEKLEQSRNDTVSLKQQKQEFDKADAQFVALRKELRDLRAKSHLEVKRTTSIIKWINIGLVPLVTLIFGIIILVKRSRFTE